MQVLTSLLTRLPIRVAAIGVVIVLAASACGSGAVEAPPSAPPRSVTTTADGPLVQQLTNAVAETGAMQHMQALQKIADENGGNRAAGTAGYGASADYVVGALRSAGFEASTPTYKPQERLMKVTPRQGATSSRRPAAEIPPASS